MMSAFCRFTAVTVSIFLTKVRIIFNLHQSRRMASLDFGADVDMDSTPKKQPTY